jgi:aminoglycoside phosphotransferase (APT) family kinase protein
MPPVQRFFLDLEPDTARSVLADIDPGLELAGIVRLHGGSNEIYRLDLAGGAAPLVIKFYSPEPAWVPSKEKLVAGWIGAAPIPIPRWLALDETRTRLAASFAVTTWLPGAAMRAFIGEPRSAAAYRRMGALLRQLHALPMPAFGYILDHGIERPVADNATRMARSFERIFELFRERGGDAALARKLEAAVAPRAGVLAYCPAPMFCHDDFHPGNVLAEPDADGELQLTGLIDFGNAQAGDPLMDLAKALFCCGHEDPTSVTPLREGYGAPDHPDPEAALWLYTLYHRVSMWQHLAGFGHPGEDLLRDLAGMVA